jgi:sulfoxide reductase heme-binding subunit YedZ
MNEAISAHRRSSSIDRSRIVRLYVKPALFVVCLLPFLRLLLGAFEIAGMHLGTNAVETVQDVTGQWGLRFLLITLAITPLRDWFNACSACMRSSTCSCTS